MYKRQDVFCRESRDRVEASFRALYGKHDAKLYSLAQAVARGEHAWLERGMAGVADVEGIERRTVAIDEPEAVGAA